MKTHYNVFRRFFRTVYIIAITYEQIMNARLTFVHLHNFPLFLYFFYKFNTYIFSTFSAVLVYFVHLYCFLTNKGILSFRLISVQQTFGKIDHFM